MLNTLKLICLSLVILSCTEKITTSNEVYRYTENSFEDRQSIKSIDLKGVSNELINPIRLFKFKHYLFVSDRKSEKPLHIYDTKNDKYLGQFIVKGKGPGELLDIRSLSSIDENSFMIFDPITQRIFGYDIDSLITNDKPIFEKKLKLSGLPHTFVKTKNDLYFTRQSDPSARVFKIDFNNTTSPEEVGLGTLPNVAKKGHSKITNAHLSMSNMKFRKGKFVFIYLLNPMVDIYDVSKDSWRSIISPTDFIPEYTLPDGPYFAFSKKTLAAYADLALTDKYIYALYSGETFLNENKRVRNEANRIYVFDYEGRPVKEITLDTNLASIAIIGNTLYGLSMDDVKPKIVKFEL